MDCSPVIVKTVYPFKGNNNDELCFKKGETIIITQKDEEWWEGTLHGKTGWFPCNYVKECKDTPRLSTPDENKFKMMVLTDLVESEKAYVKELEGLVGNFLQPLEETSMLLKKEYSQLINNIMEILDFHQQFLEALETESCKMEHLQKIGKLFLEWAPKLKNIHSAYCSFHPNAVCVLDKYRNELANYMEQRGAASPGLLVLTTLLSKPFRRLNKYSYMLQELERYVGESHPDRGDIQRAVSVFKHLAETCMAIRRQKELELQVLTGPVRGWEGPSLTSLGEIIHMSSVTLGTEKSERYLVLFSNTLIILSVSHRLSAFIYEGQLSPSALSNIRRIENNVLGFKNSFEMYGPLIEKVVVHCQHADDADKWVELLRRYHSNCFNLPTILDLNPFEHKSLQTVCMTQVNPTKCNDPAIYTNGFLISCYPPIQLSEYFSKQIQDKVITSALLSQLLHREYFNYKTNKNVITIRYYRTECYIVPTYGHNFIFKKLYNDNEQDKALKERTKLNGRLVHGNFLFEFKKSQQNRVLKFRSPRQALNKHFWFSLPSIEQSKNFRENKLENFFYLNNNKSPFILRSGSLKPIKNTMNPYVLEDILGKLISNPSYSSKAEDSSVSRSSNRAPSKLVPLKTGKNTIFWRSKH